MQNSNNAPGNFLKTTSIIYFALIAGQLAFMGVAYSIASDLKMTNDIRSLNDMLLMVIPFVALGGISASFMMFKMQLSKIDKEAPLANRLNAYRAALIARYALLEGPSLFAIVGFLLTGNFIFLGISGFIILIFLYFRPTRDKVAQDLELKNSEAELL